MKSFAKTTCSALVLAAIASFGVLSIVRADEISNIDPAENSDITAPFVYSIPVVPSGSLIAGISFDETDGEVARDSSQNGNDAIVASDTVWAPGMSGGSISFDGTDARALIPNDVIGTASVTVCAWYNANTSPAGAILISNSKFSIYINQNGSISVTNDGINAVSTSDSIISGAWNHICVARDTSGTVSVNINDRLSAQGYAGQPVVGAEVGIGGHPWENNHGWDGMIDDVRIYSGIVNIQ